MPRFMPTSIHGVLDYGTVAMLLALPRLLKPSRPAAGMITVAALSTLFYSMFTRYELGIKKLLPMRAHLAMDGMSGAAFLGAPALLRDEDAAVRGALLGIGLFEISAALLTVPEDSVD